MKLASSDRQRANPPPLIAGAFHLPLDAATVVAAAASIVRNAST